MTVVAMAGARSTSTSSRRRPGPKCCARQLNLGPGLRRGDDGSLRRGDGGSLRRGDDSSLRRGDGGSLRRDDGRMSGGGAL